MSLAYLDKQRRKEEERADALELARVLREPAEEPRRPSTQPLLVRDGDLLLIGNQGAIDPTGYEELAARFDHPIASDGYDPEDARLREELRLEGWPG